MSFDVIIPSKERQEDIYRMIDSVLLSSSKPLNIIVVDQSEKPYDLSKYNNEDVKIIHHYDPRISGASVARNVGVGLSKADLVYIFDDDIILDIDFLEKINRYFEMFPETMGICGRQKNSKSSISKIIAFSIFHIGEFKDARKKLNSGLVKKGIYKVNMLSGGIVGFRRRLFDEFQFDDIFIRGSLGEDRDFSYRVSKKYTLMFATDALALHNHSSVGRYDAIEEYACKCASYALFYKKNLEKNYLNYFCYRLVDLGICLDALMYVIKNRNISSIKGIIKGHKYINNQFEGVPFIDSHKYKERYT